MYKTQPTAISPSGLERPFGRHKKLKLFFLFIHLIWLSVFMSAQIFHSAMTDQSRITGMLHHVKTDAFEKMLAMEGMIMFGFELSHMRPSKDHLK